MDKSLTKTRNRLKSKKDICKGDEILREVEDVKKTRKADELQSAAMETTEEAVATVLSDIASPIPTGNNYNSRKKTASFSDNSSDDEVVMPSPAAKKPARQRQTASGVRGRGRGRGKAATTTSTRQESSSTAAAAKKPPARRSAKRKASSESEVEDVVEAIDDDSDGLFAPSPVNNNQQRTNSNDIDATFEITSDGELHPSTNTAVASSSISTRRPATPATSKAPPAKKRTLKQTTLQFPSASQQSQQSTTTTVPKTQTQGGRGGVKWPIRRG